MWKDVFLSSFFWGGVSYIQSHRLLGPGLLHLVVHDGVVDAQPTEDHKRLKTEQQVCNSNMYIMNIAKEF